MTTFQIQNSDGSFSAVSHDEFYKILNDEGGFLYYRQGGSHIAMLPTAENEETLRICTQEDTAERDAAVINTRCRDEKGQPCRYQHDANGHVIRNEKGHAVRAKCGDCPRNGWQTGKRENCCIRNYCKVDDCAYCPSDREYYVPISLDWLIENKRDGGDSDGGGFHITDADADIQTAFEDEELESALLTALEQLPPREQAVIKATYWNNLSRRAYSNESGMPFTTVKRLHNKALETLKEILKDFF